VIRSRIQDANGTRHRPGNPGSRWVMRAAAVLAMVVLGACHTTRPDPLDRAVVDRALAPPSFQALRIAAAHIRHPILSPVVLDAARGLDATSAGVVAVLVNPSLRAVRDQRALAAAQIIQAGLLPNPQLSASFLRPFRGQPGFTNGWSVGLAWDVSALVSRGARLEAARDAAAEVDLDIAWQEWQVAAAARLAVWRVLAVRDKIAIAASLDRRAREQADLTAAAVRDGDRLAADLTSALSAAADAHQTFLDVQQDEVQQSLALARAIGVADVPAVADGPVPELPVPDAATLEADLADRRLDLLALRRGYDSQDATVRAAVLGRFPHLSLGLDRARDTTQVQTLGPSLTIDLPLFDRNQAAIASESATRDRLRDEFVARVFDARADIAAAEALLAACDAQRAAAARAIAIAADSDAFQRRAVRLGFSDALTAGAAHLAWLQRRLDKANLDQVRIETVAALELAAGTPLVPAPGGPATGAPSSSPVPAAPRPPTTPVPDARP
jgi:outer membrane protein TolC